MGKIPLYPPLAKGESAEPPFHKGGLGGFETLPRKLFKAC